MVMQICLRLCIHLFIHLSIHVRSKFNFFCSETLLSIALFFSALYCRPFIKAIEAHLSLIAISVVNLNAFDIFLNLAGLLFQIHKFCSPINLLKFAEISLIGLSAYCLEWVIQITYLIVLEWNLNFITLFYLIRIFLQNFLFFFPST